MVVLLFLGIHLLVVVEVLQVFLAQVAQEVVVPAAQVLPSSKSLLYKIKLPHFITLHHGLYRQV